MVFTRCVAGNLGRHGGSDRVWFLVSFLVFFLCCFLRDVNNSIMELLIMAYACKTASAEQIIGELLQLCYAIVYAGLCPV